MLKSHSSCCGVPLWSASPDTQWTGSQVKVNNFVKIYEKDILQTFLLCSGILDVFTCMSMARAGGDLGYLILFTKIYIYSRTENWWSVVMKGLVRSDVGYCRIKPL